MRFLAPLYAAVFLLLAHGAASAAGQAPDGETCKNSATQDAVTQGGCIAIERRKGNCQACHFIAGIPSGNIGAPLVGVAERFKDRARLRAQIDNPAQFNPATIMPLYGKHAVLTPEEIDKVIEWLLTL